MADSTGSNEIDRKAEAAIVRREVLGLLERRGFRIIHDVPGGSAQVIEGIDPTGRQVRLLVKRCWARGIGRHENYAATQLIEFAGRDTGARADAIRRRMTADGLTYCLAVLYDFDLERFVLALLMPADQVGFIWKRQHELAAKFIASGRAGRMKENPADNGDYPTLILEDLRTEGRQIYTSAPWNWPGAVNVLKLPLRAPEAERDDDTYDDHDAGPGDAGRDAGKRVKTTRSGVRRDPKVRRLVLKRANKCCERCGEHREFSAFLDVHHILGVEASDRVWTCVALCPNCHREAHYAPHAANLNAELRDYAAQFRPAKRIS